MQIPVQELRFISRKMEDGAQNERSRGNHQSRPEEAGSWLGNDKFEPQRQISHVHSFLSVGSVNTFVLNST